MRVNALRVCVLCVCVLVLVFVCVCVCVYIDIYLHVYVCMYVCMNTSIRLYTYRDKERETERGARYLRIKSRKGKKQITHNGQPFHRLTHHH
jgi:hypothetical protein